MFETFDHTADLGIRVRAETLQGLFEEAATALFSVMVVDQNTIRPNREFSFHIAVFLKQENAQLKQKLAVIEERWDGIVKRKTGEYLKLKKTHETIMETVGDLTTENNILKTSQMTKWFGMGALVLLCGLMIGLLVGRQQKKIRSTIQY